MGNNSRLFDSEERRFLFELALLGLTSGCKLEGLLFAMSLETLEGREPYATVARAIGHMQFDQLDEAETLLSSPLVTRSEQSDYATMLRSMIAHMRGNRSQVEELAATLEKPGVDPTLLKMAAELLASR
jgi:hypothetical protein